MSTIFYKLLKIIFFHKLCRLGCKTGIQIGLGTCGEGLTIWHYGPIIVNGKARLGRNCTLYPGVLIGHKSTEGGAAVIGNNVFIGAGTKIIGEVHIGNNVTIGQNCVITKDIPDNAVVVCGAPLRYLNK